MSRGPFTSFPPRLAVAADAPQISALMRSSVLDLFPRVYSAAQTASAAVHIAHLDPLLIEDGTYYVHEVHGEIVACGGWSRRAKLYTGSNIVDDETRLIDPLTEAARVRAMFVRHDFTRRGLARSLLTASEDTLQREGFRSLVLMATLPGVPLYLSYGFQAVSETELVMPDGVSLACLLMSRSL